MDEQFPYFNINWSRRPDQSTGGVWNEKKRPQRNHKTSLFTTAEFDSLDVLKTASAVMRPSLVAVFHFAISRRHIEMLSSHSVCYARNNYIYIYSI